MGIYQKILAGKIYFPKYFDKNAKVLNQKRDSTGFPTGFQSDNRIFSKGYSGIVIIFLLFARKMMLWYFGDSESSMA